MISLHYKDGGSDLGTIDEADLALMQAQFEEESSRDQDYYVDATAIGLLQEAGASASMLALLRGALGAAEGVDIVWRRG
jgi:hypothetical protein